jgi:hypothetical protein
LPFACFVLVPANNTIGALPYHTSGYLVNSPGILNY